MNPRHPKGFTLVEIMIVVVIIGLLAALSIPAFRKIRNNAIEKSLFNDAKQVSSGVCQVFSDNPTIQLVTAEKIIGSAGFVSSLSSGVVLYSQNGACTAGTLTQAPLSSIEFSHPQTVGPVGIKCYFSVGHNNYNTSISSNTNIANTAYYPEGARGLQFAIDSGRLLDGASAPSVVLK